MTPKSFAPSILSPESYRLTQGFVWARYAAALFLPLHLNVDTDLQPFARLNAEALTGLLFVLGLLTLIVHTARRRSLYPIAFGLLWFVITQLPTSLYPLSEVENDHRMIFSFPGLILAVVWGLHLGYRQLQAKMADTTVLRPVAATLAALCLCGYAYGAHRRNAVWFSEDTLWADDVAKSSHNGRGLMIYGLTRMNAGDQANALRLFTEALRYTPSYPTLEINLGVVNGNLADQGQPALGAVAERHFRRALQLAQNDDTAHAYYGRWLLAQNRLPEAIFQLQTALALNPQRLMQRDLLLTAFQRAGSTVAAHALAQQTLALLPGDPLALAVLQGHAGTSEANLAAANLINASLASYRTGHFQNSIAQARQALQLDSGSAVAWNNIGTGLEALHQWNEAVVAEQKALAIDPTLGIAQNNLHWFQAQKDGSFATKPAQSAVDYVNLSFALNQQGRYEQSLEAAQSATRLDPHSADAWNNIAAADEALHRWDEAIQAAQQAIALRPDFQMARNNLAWSLQQKVAAK